MNEQQRDPWKEHLNGLVQTAATLTASSFMRERNLPRAMKLMEKLYQIGNANMDSVYARLEALPEEQKLKMAPQCKDGCDYCCHQLVRASACEVIAVYVFLQQNLSADQLEALHQHLIDYREALLKHGSAPHFREACPLLVNHRCSVYPARPLICRGITSANVEACKEGFESPSQEVRIPAIESILNISVALTYGLTTTLEQQRMGGTHLVLGLALLVLFEDPQAVDKYFAGYPIFNDVAFSK